jgi:hypothetical protein
MNWQQLQAILWLRFRLSYNQLSRGNPLNAVVSMLSVIAGLGLAVVATVGGFTLGWTYLATASPRSVLLALDAFALVFLFAWTIGLLVELQKSETLDMSRMLHLPVSLRQLFLLNYAASLLTPSMVITAPALVAMALGASVGGRPGFLVLIPLGLGFLLMISAWTACLRGWLASLMVNARRRRSIVATFTLLMVILAQGPNLYLNVFRRHAAQAGHRRHGGTDWDAAEWVDGPTGTLVHQVVPIFWLGAGARGVAEGSVLPGLAGATGCGLLGYLGLRRAYRGALRFYTGATTGVGSKSGSKVPPAPAPAANGTPAAAPSPGTHWMERTLPGVPDDASALALACLRSLLRAPETRLLLLSPLFALGFVVLMISQAGRQSMPPELTLLIPTIVMTLLFLSSMQLLTNQFGFDRSGFRTMLLLPTPRDRILLGKNLSFAPLILGPGLVLLAVLPLFITVQVTAWIAAVLQLGALFLILCTLGNVCSIMLPFRVNPGSLKPTKQPAMTMFLVALLHMVFPLICLPVYIPPVAQLLLLRFRPALHLPVSLMLSIPLLAVAVAGYALSLRPLARWLQAREKQVLMAVTQEVE